MISLSGNRSRRKGYEAERELANILNGERVPLSGATGGQFSGDVIALGLRWECKRRADGFKQIYQWLDGKDALAFRADRKPWLVTMTLDTFLKLIGRSGEHGSQIGTTDSKQAK